MVDVAPDEAAAVFLMREPWPGHASGTALTFGLVAEGDVLLVVSRINKGGVVFAHRVEGNRLDFTRGKILRVTIGGRQLRLFPRQ